MRVAGIWVAGLAGNDASESPNLIAAVQSHQFSLVQWPPGALGACQVDSGVQDAIQCVTARSHAGDGGLYRSESQTLDHSQT